MPRTEVTYICGLAGMGKTMLAEALKLYLETRRKGYPRVKIIEEDTLKNIEGSCISGDWDAIIVDWPAGMPENFPVNPLRVIRIGKG